MSFIYSKPPKPKKHLTTTTPCFDWGRLNEARRLDFLADLELANGRASHAEKLAHAAQALREVAQ